MNEKSVRYVLFHPTWGIYLGNALGLGFWSRLDAVGQDAAVTFQTEDAAMEHARSWDGGCDGVTARAVETAEEDASIDECQAAGLPSWDPNFSLGVH